MTKPQTLHGIESGRGQLGPDERGTCSWQGMSNEDLSLIQAKYAMPTTLNQVGEEPNSTIAPEASGSDYPHLVVLDFSQDLD